MRIAGSNAQREASVRRSAGWPPPVADAMSIACPLCGIASTTTWLRRGDWQYRHCSACSAVWLDPLPTDAWAKQFYDRGYFEGGGRGGYRDYLADEVQHQANARARVALVRRHGAAPPGLWIDVGCAAGYTLVEARDAGFQVSGVDLSPWAELAHTRFGLELFAMLAQAQQVHANRAAVVSFFQVLEHMPDPLLALRQARGCLRVGGLLVIETWDRSSLAARLFGRHWQQITPPSVAWLFDRKSITAALTRAGFETRAIRATAKVVSIGWACGLLADKLPGFLAPMLSRIASSRLGRVEMNYRLGDLVTVIAVARSTCSGNAASTTTAVT